MPIGNRQSKYKTIAKSENSNKGLIERFTKRNKQKKIGPSYQEHI